MGYAIIKKGKKSIKIPEFLVKVGCFFGTSISFSNIKNVSEIYYYDIDFYDWDLFFFRKKVTFDNCKFSESYIHLNESSLISNSEFKKCELYCERGKSVDLTVNEKDSKSKFIIKANNIKIQGENASSSNYSFRGGNIQVIDTSIYANRFNIEGDFVDITSSEIIAKEDVSLAYDKLYLENIYFESESDVIRFKDYNINEEICYYKNFKSDMTVIGNFNLSNDKDKSTYSLISILKAYKNKICKMNEEELKRQREKIDLKVAPKLEDIDSQIEALMQKRSSINNSVFKQKMLLEDEYNNHKVKSIGVRK